MHQRWDGQQPLTVLEIRADGIPPARFIQLFQHFEDLFPKFTKDVKCQPLPSVNGFRMVHQRIEMPILMSNRSLFTTYYDIDGLQPGEYQFISSSWGNELYQQKYSKLSGRDVIAQLNLNFIGIKPVKNGQNETVGTYVQ